VYVHTCMKMHCYFPLNVKHGASRLYWGGLQLSSAGTAGTSSNLSGVVEIDEFAVFRCHIFVSFRNNVGINCTLRQYTVLDSCRHQ